MMRLCPEQCRSVCLIYEYSVDITLGNQVNGNACCRRIFQRIIITHHCYCPEFTICLHYTTMANNWQGVNILGWYNAALKSCKLNWRGVNPERGIEKKTRLRVIFSSWILELCIVATLTGPVYSSRSSNIQIPHCLSGQGLSGFSNLTNNSSSWSNTGRKSAPLVPNRACTISDILLSMYTSSSSCQ